MVVAYSTINLWFYKGLLYYRLGEVGLIIFIITWEDCWAAAAAAAAAICAAVNPLA